jgi:hypothetical protein
LLQSQFPFSQQKPGSSALVAKVDCLQEQASVLELVKARVLVTVPELASKVLALALLEEKESVE